MTKRIAAVVVVLIGIAKCGGPGGQSMECKRYVDCVAKLSGSSASLDSTYGFGGTCWDDAASAETCTRSCKNALSAFPSDAGC